MDSEMNMMEISDEDMSSDDIEIATMPKASEYVFDDMLVDNEPDEAFGRNTPEPLITQPVGKLPEYTYTERDETPRHDFYINPPQTTYSSTKLKGPNQMPSIIEIEESDLDRLIKFRRKWLVPQNDDIQGMLEGLTDHNYDKPVCCQYPCTPPCSPTNARVYDKEPMMKCPYCHRTFWNQVAARHIPICKKNASQNRLKRPRWR